MSVSGGESVQRTCPLQIGPSPFLVSLCAGERTPDEEEQFVESPKLWVRKVETQKRVGVVSIMFSRL